MGIADRKQTRLRSRTPVPAKATGQLYALGRVGNVEYVQLQANPAEAAVATFRSGGSTGTVIGELAAPAGRTVFGAGFWFTDGLHVTLSSGLARVYFTGLPPAATTVPRAGLTLVQDNFDGPAGQNIQDHDADVDVIGAGWTNVFGTYLLDGDGSAVPGNLGGGNVRAVIDAGMANVRIESLLINGGQEAGLIFRYVNLDNNWIIRTRDAANDLQIVERTAGVNTTRATEAVNVDTGVLYKMVIILVDDSISGFFHRADDPAIDFVEIAFTSSSHQNATLHGIRDTHAASQQQYFEIIGAE